MILIIIFPILLSSSHYSLARRSSSDFGNISPVYESMTNVLRNVEVISLNLERYKKTVVSIALVQLALIVINIFC